MGSTSDHADDSIVNPIHPSVEGMLSEQTKAIYNAYQSRRLRADQVSFEEYDADRAKFSFPRDKVAPPFCPVGETAVYHVPVFDPPGQIEVKVYTPTADRIAAAFPAGSGTKLPLYVDYHGGGFVLGTLDDDDSLCRQLCQNTPCVVANVAYRLSPEFQHPVPTTDSWAALRWLVAHADTLGVDTRRIAIGGLSAGGCIAAALAQLARDEPSMPPLALQVLIVPVLDARYMPVEGRPDPDPSKTPYETYIACEFAPMLPIARLVWFYNLWLGTGPERQERASDIMASPILVENLAGLAPASFHVAEVDPLRSEALAYHEKLTKAGVASEMHIYKGAVHPFGQWDGQLEEGKQLHRDLASALQGAFKIPQ